MLKSPSSILNSIKKMKSNLRNDKEQLRIIKNNFVYLEQPFEDASKHIAGGRYEDIKKSKESHNHQLELNKITEEENAENQNHNRSKSLFTINYLKEKSIENSNKENNNDLSNNASRVSEISKKTKNNNKLYIEDQADNILKDLNNFRRNSFSKITVKDENKTTFREREEKLKNNDDDSKKETVNMSNNKMKSIKSRYQNEIERIKLTFEEEKLCIVNEYRSRLESQQFQYENQLNELKEYIIMLEEQLERQNSTDMEEHCEEKKYIEKVNQSMQMSSLEVEAESQKETANQETQTYSQNNYDSNQFSSIPHSVQSIESLSQLQFISNKYESDIQSENSPNQPISRVSIYHNDLIEQICLQFEQSNPINSYPQSQYSSVEQSHLKLNNYERERYEHIINRLLEENTKMQRKIEKIYSSHHQSNHSEHHSNSHKEKPTCFFKNHGINYKTVKSNKVENSNFNSFSNEESKVIHRYFQSNQQNEIGQNSNNQSHSQSNQSSHPHESSEPISEFTSRVNDSASNFQSNRESSNEFKNKGSIIYRISNVLSSERYKDGKNSSRSKIPNKNPPIQVKQEQKSTRSHHMRMKTEICERPAYNEFNSHNEYHDLTSSYKQTSNQENSNSMISSNNHINPCKEFKFYDEDSSKFSQEKKNFKQPEKKSNISWEDESESEILNDEMKLKTIKNFNCFSKE